MSKDKPLSLNDNPYLTCNGRYHISKELSRTRPVSCCRDWRVARGCSSCELPSSGAAHGRCRARALSRTALAGRVQLSSLQEGQRTLLSACHPGGNTALVFQAMDTVKSRKVALKVRGAAVAPI